MRRQRSHRALNTGVWVNICPNTEKRHKIQTRYARLPRVLYCGGKNTTHILHDGGGHKQTNTKSTTEIHKSRQRKGKKLLPQISPISPSYKSIASARQKAETTKTYITKRVALICSCDARVYARVCLCRVCLTRRRTRAYVSLTKSCLLAAERKAKEKDVSIS